ncbi:hypothetical protein AB0N05_02455 [Nocardia sp. NPDC051030]|uniref:hypothetical protein n=1 Tax=Nocardia sp. NPDC051030 TaxID=3155162 RepID=UPI00342B5055
MIRRSARIALSVVAALAVSVLVGSSTPAAGVPYTDPQPPDPTYPFTEVGQLLTGTVRDLTAPGMLQYLLQAGIAVNATQIARPFEDLTNPQTWIGPDAQQRQLMVAQKIWDALVHNQPFGAGLPPHPDYLPDWNHDGNFFNDVNDAVLDDNYTDPNVRDAKFRYPCINSDGSVFYETTDGDCVPGNTPTTFKLGTVSKFTIVNNRGIPLIAKVWLPEGAAESGTKYPVTVMAPGATEKQIDVAMYTQSAVRKGFVGITFEEAGNGNGEGSILDMFLPLLAVPHCQTPGGCRDVQDVVRWVNNAPITPIADPNNEIGNALNGIVPRLVRQNPDYAPAGDNITNPWIDLMDLDHVNLWGQSYGSVGVTSYPYWQDKGFGIDGQPLPKVSSVVALSGFSDSPASIPIQFQTADFDIPALGAYGITSQPNGYIDATDGPIGTKERYDIMRRDKSRTAPLQFITYEGGSHGDSINWPAVPRNILSPALSTTYAVNWFQCYGRADADQSACEALSSPLPGLSRAFATEYSPQGPSGPSLCVTIPDRATLIQAILRPDWFSQNNTGPARYDCTPQK